MDIELTQRNDLEHGSPPTTASLVLVVVLVVVVLVVSSLAFGESTDSTSGTLVGGSDQTSTF